MQHIGNLRVRINIPEFNRSTDATFPMYSYDIENPEDRTWKTGVNPNTLERGYWAVKKCKAFSQAHKLINKFLKGTKKQHTKRTIEIWVEEVKQ